jgi:hypothetical protein
MNPVRTLEVQDAVAQAEELVEKLFEGITGGEAYGEDIAPVYDSTPDRSAAAEPPQAYSA